MYKRYSRCLLLVAVVGFLSFQQKPSPKPFAPLKQLAGKWAMATPKGMLYEEWAIASDSLLIGSSYRIKQNDTTLLETMKLQLTGSSIAFIPTAIGQNEEQPVVFTLHLPIDSSTYIFENRQHDFPKRVVYQLVSSDSIHAWIDDGTAQKRRHFYYKKQR